MSATPAVIASAAGSQGVLRFDTPSGTPLALEPVQLVVAGWTGRDRAAIEHHIEELGRLGVPRPSAVPLYYRLSRSLLTQADAIEALGTASSGEAEPVLLRQGGRWWLTVGSDHTDRAAEAYSVAASKQMCAKPLARQAWPWEEVAGRADGLELSSEILEFGADGDPGGDPQGAHGDGGRWVTYQRGHLSAITSLMDIVRGLPADLPVADGLVLFCGTLGAIPDAAGTGVRPAAAMRVSLADPQGGRRITHRYTVATLPMVA